MPKIFRLSILFIGFCVAVGLHSALAQDAAMSSAPAFNGGVFVTPVPNAPFYALAMQEMAQILSDGNSFRRKTSAVIARDSTGRIHNESHQVIPVSATREPALLSIHIYDPNTRINLFLNPYTHIAQERILANPPSASPPANWAQHESGNRTLPPGIREEDLGSSVIESFDAHGYRRTIAISDKSSGTGKPVTITDEYWYSEELHINLVTKHNDPRTGSLAIAVKNINVGEPAVELFDVPPEYKVVDLTPPDAANSPNTVPVVR